jgi:hypothetical protein
MFRVYYNRSEDFPYIWSLDTGEQKDERIIKGYSGGTIAGCGYDFDVPQGSTTQPRAWIEVTADRVYIDTEGFAHFE